MAKPRQTRRDKHSPSKAVQRYRNWADEVRLRKVPEAMGSCNRVTFMVPMPRTWTPVRKQRAAYTPHTQTPDLDNMVKALLDACMPDGDQTVWSVWATKLWSWEPLIIVEAFPDNCRPLVRADLINTMEERQQKLRVEKETE